MFEFFEKKKSGFTGVSPEDYEVIATVTQKIANSGLSLPDSDKMEKEMENFLSSESFGTPDQVINARCDDMNDTIVTSTEEMTNNTTRIAELSGKNIARDMMVKSGENFIKSFDGVNDLTVVEKIVENVRRSVDIANDELKRDVKEITRLEARNDKLKALIDACEVFVKGFVIGKASMTDSEYKVKIYGDGSGGEFNSPNAGEGPDGETGPNVEEFTAVKNTGGGSGAGEAFVKKEKL